MITTETTTNSAENREMESSSIIYHMLPAPVWSEQAADQPYEGDTLATEGFIHCTGERKLLVKVANNFYRDTPDPYVILYIDPSLVESEIRWEEAGLHTFPHIYGPLNLDSVVKVIPFPRSGDGVFELPHEW